MSFRTPLSKVRGLGSAKSGTEHFWQQRLTAIANIPLVLFLICFASANIGATRSDVIAAVAHPFNAVLLICAIVSMVWHMRLGMQVVIEDYIHGELCRMLAIMANTIFCGAVVLAGLFAILKLSLGG